MIKNNSKGKNKPMWFHFKHKWLPWTVTNISTHVYQVRACEKCNYTVSRVKVEQNR